MLYHTTPLHSHKQPDFQSLQLHTFHPNNRKRSHGISLSGNSFDVDSDYQEIQDELIFNLPSNRIKQFLF